MVTGASNPAYRIIVYYTSLLKWNKTKDTWQLLWNCPTSCEITWRKCWFGWKSLMEYVHLQQMRWGPTHKHTYTHSHTCEVTITWLCKVDLYENTHTQALEAWDDHKGPCHMLSRYIPTQWCQFVHLNLRLLIYSSEILQLKATLNTAESFLRQGW